MKSFRVAEIFGPTIQGEGRRAGTPCHFIRFSGCDYRCDWCDSPHAVLPEYVVNTPHMTESEIVQKVLDLPKGPRWVVFSGGNPLLFDLAGVQSMLANAGFGTMVETQGTVEKDWIRATLDVCISPKPPSSGNVTPVSRVWGFLRQFEHRAPKSTYYPYLKVVVFTDEDYEYAKMMHKEFEGQCDFYLSVGTMFPGLKTVANPEDNAEYGIDRVRVKVLDDTVRLFERVAHDPDMAHVRVLPQLHTLVWGNRRGV